VTNVEFDYINFSTAGGHIEKHIISTLNDKTSSGGLSLFKDFKRLDGTAKLLYHLHIHPGGDSQPSGGMKGGDVKGARKHPGAVFQIYTRLNGYTTYDGLGNYYKDNRR
jgi:hypothetical protein